MKRSVIALVAVVAAFSSLPSHAINAHFRQQLERSGCTQVTEANGTCDPRKTKAQNAASSKKSANSVERLQVQRFIDDSVLNQNIDDAAEALIGYGWKANNGVWKKHGMTLRLQVVDEVVVNASLR